MKTLSLYWFDIDPQTVSVLKSDGTRRTRQLTAGQADRLTRFFLRVRGLYGRGGLSACETFTGRMIYRKEAKDAWLL